MNITENRKRMTSHELFGIIFGAIITAVVAATEKIMAAISLVTYINPDAKQFIIDLYPFISAGVGLFTIILLIYTIVKTHKQINGTDKK